MGERGKVEPVSKEFLDDGSLERKSFLFWNIVGVSVCCGHKGYGQLGVEKIADDGWPYILLGMRDRCGQIRVGKLARCRTKTWSRRL